MNKKILDIVAEKKIISRYSYMSLSLFIAAIYYNLLLRPIHLVTGGTGGVGILLESWFGLSPSLTTFFMLFGFVILSYFYLGKEDTIAALFIAIVYPLFISATEGVTDIFLLDASNPLVMVLYAGVLSGITDGMIYITGLNTGGFGVASKILAEKFKVSTSSVNAVINFIIVGIGTFKFGLVMLFYAVIYLYISKAISERVFLGISKNKMVCIVTTKYDKISSYLIEEMNHDSTVYEMINDINKRDQKMIMTMIPTKEYFLLKEGVMTIDKRAFLFVCDSYEVAKQDMRLKSVK